MLPHADNAIVDEAKICDYLLSDTHPVGRFKASVFSSLGYTVESWTRLRDDLLHHGQTGTVQRIEISAYGMKVVISATLKGPNGASRPFRTVWLILDHSRQPRLVTAFPE
ncbi:adhesin [Cyanobium sp. Candia 9D4]|uniref:DUF6883 domain-containing protein n=1 Tax=Cyanobium sp. Candia 9D4 TaxID=2823707 RepID=UPI0037C08E8E|nr:adhesin [Cyanobium sp. Candia 9D4]